MASQALWIRLVSAVKKASTDENMANNNKGNLRWTNGVDTGGKIWTARKNSLLTLPLEWLIWLKKKKKWRRAITAHNQPLSFCLGRGSSWLSCGSKRWVFPRSRAGHNPGMPWDVQAGLWGWGWGYAQPNGWVRSQASMEVVWHRHPFSTTMRRGETPLKQLTDLVTCHHHLTAEPAPAPAPSPRRRWSYTLEEI